AVAQQWFAWVGDQYMDCRQGVTFDDDFWIAAERRDLPGRKPVEHHYFAGTQRGQGGIHISKLLFEHFARPILWRGGGIDRVADLVRLLAGQSIRTAADGRFALGGKRS